MSRLWTTACTLGILLMGTNAALAQPSDNNGFPSGTHYTLNIQGKPNCAGDDLTGSQRHTIQVLLNFSSDEKNLVDKTNKIMLQPGPAGSQPQVIDGNACDQGGALFQLPIDVSSYWQAYARALSKPDTSMDITSCFLDTGLDQKPGGGDDTIVCSTTGNSLVLTRKSGKPVTIDATDELLFVCTGSTMPNCQGGTEIPIFFDMFDTYFWDVDNHGLRNAQIRLYAK